MQNVTSRLLAHQTLMRVALEGASLDALLPQLYDAPLSAPDKGFARQLVMATLRHYGQLGALIDAYVPIPLTGSAAAVNVLLRMGAAQLLLLGTPPHAAIDTSVQLCKQIGFVAQAGLVNAVLRKLAAEQPPLAPATHNMPSWMKGAWRSAYGREATDAIAEQCLKEPPLDLSFNTNVHFNYDENPHPLWHNMQRIANQDITQLEGYDEGAFWVQDVAATLPVRALGDVSGKLVVDVCAAPGGKTLQLCAGGAQVIALDRSENRLKTLRSNLDRCGFAGQVQVLCADATQWQPDALLRAPDMVLLDAPCSATGTVRRHPDIWLRKSQQEVAEMVQLQRAILERIMHWLPPHALLVYAVCSLQLEEGEGQLAWLQQHYPQLRLEPFAIDGVPDEWHKQAGTLRTLPHYFAEQGGMDGFFIAKLRRCG